MINISAGVCGTFGVTGSISSYGSTGSGGSIGITGHRGQPGVPGVNPDYKEALFYCKKSCGFFEKDRYYTILLHHGFGIYYIKSTDSRCSLSLSDEEMSDHFIWGPELRDKKIDQIFTNLS